jgi:hypothetical protein
MRTANLCGALPVIVVKCASFIKASAVTDTGTL